MKTILAVVAAFLIGVMPVQAQIAVVVHPSTPVTELTSNALLDIYSLEQVRWSDGTRIVALTLESSAEEFYGAIGRSYGDLRKIWLRRQLSGEGQPPEIVRDAATVLKRVAAAPGVIGFVPAASVDTTVRVVATLD
jgi:ABC-type phosphate transport system substrate-binding protein